MILRLSKKTTGTRMLTFYLCAVIFIFTATATMTVAPKPAHAAICCVSCCNCVESTVILDLAMWLVTWLSINIFILAQLLIHRTVWFDIVFWQQTVLPALMQVGISLSAVSTFQTMVIGMFIDAKEQLETQRLLQELHAKTHKDYHPSIGMCEFGTRVTTLASSERQGEVNARILSQRSTGLFLNNQAANSGVSGDVKTRLTKYQTAFCDSFDNENSLAQLCPQRAPTGTSADEVEERDRFNKDIDYQRTILDPLTLNADFTSGGEATDQEEEIFAMASNLYGFDAFDIAEYDELANNPDSPISSAQEAYLDARATIAKTKVAENSFNALVALKSAGTDNNSRQFLASYLEELGMPATDIEEFIGENPSYYAQMEILTKKAYQSPLFYTNLYDKPANVKRKGVAIQAISLIQKFDLLKSHLRTEASLSIMLELAVGKLQREVEDNILAFQKGRAATQD